MTVSCQNLLDHADSLINAAKNECEFRGVIGRAYYAVYHFSKEFHDSLASPGVIVKTNVGAHEKLISRLKNPTINPADPNHDVSIELGDRLAGMKIVRNKADYYIDLTIKPDDAIEQLELAKQVFELTT